MSEKLKEFIALDMRQVAEMSASGDIDQNLAEMIADKRLIQYATEAMNEKLTLSRMTGKGGWWRPESCTIAQLEARLAECVKKGDMVDVINFAAMIHVRKMME